MGKLKKHFTLFICLAVMMVLLPITNILAAETSTGLEYEIYDDYVEITGYTGSATELHIPSELDGLSVTSIGYSAFENCDSLTVVTIPNSVTKISEHAFRSCTSLISATIPNKVTSIGACAFYNCSSLTTVTIGDGVKEIGHSAFASCDSLTKVSIPDGVTSIGSSAFHGCTSLAKVSIPDSVSKIGDSAFSGTALYNDDSNWDNDVLYIGHHLVEARPGLSGTYAIRPGVRTIAETAFKFERNLEGVTIPNSVTSIGYYAFYYCTGLTRISGGNGVTTIDNGAFSGCNNLAKVDIGANVIYIGDRAFEGCASLAGVTIPASVTGIGLAPFSGCTGLTEIKVDVNNAYYKSENGVLFDKKMKQLVQYPIGNTRTDYDIPASVTCIGTSAFSECGSLVSVNIGDGVKTIEDEAFSRCKGLREINVDIGNENYISQNGVLFDKEITKLIQYPVGKNDFNYNIPNSVTYISCSAFEDCDSLASIYIGIGVKNIDLYAFNNCTNLTEVYYQGNEDDWQGIERVSFRNDPLDYAAKHYNFPNPEFDNELPNGLEYYADSDHVEITGYTGNAAELTIPSEIKGLPVTVIGYEAFQNVTNIAKVIMPDSVTDIERSAFYGCSNLKSINIPDSVESIEDFAFGDCKSLTEISVTPGSFKYKLVDGVLYNIDATELILAPRNISGEYVIPAGVTKVGTTAFDCCYNLSGIKFVSSIKNIGTAAFGDCVMLENLYLPLKNEDDDEIAEIGASAFYGCIGLKTVSIVLNTTWGSWETIYIRNAAFAKCANLEKVYLPIDFYAESRIFDKCDKLTDIYYVGDEFDWADVSYVDDSGIDNLNIHYKRVPFSLVNGKNYSLKIGLDYGQICVECDVLEPVIGQQTMYLVRYDEGGQMMSCSKQILPSDFRAGDEWCFYFDIEGAAKACAFVWNNEEYMMPASNAVSLDME